MTTASPSSALLPRRTTAEMLNLTDMAALPRRRTTVTTDPPPASPTPTVANLNLLTSRLEGMARQRPREATVSRDKFKRRESTTELLRDSPTKHHDHMKPLPRDSLPTVVSREAIRLRDLPTDRTTAITELLNILRELSTRPHREATRSLSLTTADLPLPTGKSILKTREATVHLSLTTTESTSPLSSTATSLPRSAMTFPASTATLVSRCSSRDLTTVLPRSLRSEDALPSRSSTETPASLSVLPRTSPLLREEVPLLVASHLALTSVEASALLQSVVHPSKFLIMLLLREATVLPRRDTEPKLLLLSTVVSLMATAEVAHTDVSFIDDSNIFVQ